jgi:hypothetical protein
MSDYIVFLGPTLSHSKAMDSLQASYRAPAAMGDLYRAAQEKPRALILIDGMFGDKPSVMHQEIMWCLSSGTHVIGASSMGALRAAELDQHGMIGWGGVYSLFARKALSDDDEVAVAHAPAELGWQAVTSALVDLRYALSKAVDSGRLSRRESMEIIQIAKSQHYGNRGLVELKALAVQRNLNAACLDVLGDHSFINGHSLKRLDAISLLSYLATSAQISGSSMQPAACTTCWQGAMRMLDKGVSAGDGQA